jgi:exodeoxyribonuclease VII large subunit
VHPAQQLQRQSQQLEQLYQRMLRVDAYRRRHWNWQWVSLMQRVQAASIDFVRLRDRQASLAQRMVRAMSAVQQRHAAKLESVAQHLVYLDPKQVLARGYSMVQDANGRVVSDAATLAAGEELRVTFAQGWAKAAVKETGVKKGKSTQ